VIHGYVYHNLPVTASRLRRGYSTIFQMRIPS